MQALLERSIMKYSEELRRRRKRAGMTLEDLAEAAEISRGYITMIENETIQPGRDAPPTPSRKMVERIAVALDWPLSDALTAAGYATYQVVNKADSTGQMRDQRLTYEPVMDGAGLIIVSTAGVAPNDRPKLKKLIESLVENFQEEENLKTFGRRVTDDDEETE